MKYQLSFIGLGHIATAIVRGVLNDKMVSPENICFHDVSETQIEVGRRELNIHYISTLSELITSSKYIFLSVRPQNLKEVFQEISKIKLSQDQCIVSVVAGLKLSVLGKIFSIPVIRAMPNLSVSVQSGITFLVQEKLSEKENLDDVISIFSCIGNTYIAQEEEFDVITAVTGAGPAYFFYFVEILTKIGINMGMKAEQMQDIVVQLMHGSSKMLQQSSAEQLRSSVISKGGVTMVAMTHLDKHNVMNIFSDALKKAQLRSQEISEEIQLALE